MDNTDDLNYTAEQCLHSIKTFSVSHIVPPEGGMGMHKKLGGNTGQLTSTVQRDILYHMESCSAYKG